MYVHPYVELYALWHKHFCMSNTYVRDVSNKDTSWTRQICIIHFLGLSSMLQYFY